MWKIGLRGESPPKKLLKKNYRTSLHVDAQRGAFESKAGERPGRGQMPRDAPAWETAEIFRRVGRESSGRFR
jgi:hypothetical protein